MPNVCFQKISMPTPRMVIGNFKGELEGGLKGQYFLKKGMKLNWNFQRGGGIQTKINNILGGSAEIFWNNTMTNK